MRVSSVFAHAKVLRTVDCKKERPIDSFFPQIPNDALPFSLVLGKTVDSLGKTALKVVDKFKKDCGISGGYLKRRILSEISKVFWELARERGF